MARLSPRLEAAQHLLKRSSPPSSRLLFLPRSGAASLPDVPERPLPATPAVGTLSSESTVPTPRWCSDCACLPGCPRSRLCTPVVGPHTSESTASTLLPLQRRGAAQPFRRRIQIDQSYLTGYRLTQFKGRGSLQSIIFSRLSLAPSWTYLPPFLHLPFTFPFLFTRSRFSLLALALGLCMREFSVFSNEIIITF